VNTEFDFQIKLLAEMAKVSDRFIWTANESSDLRPVRFEPDRTQNGVKKQLHSCTSINSTCITYTTIWCYLHP